MKSDNPNLLGFLNDLRRGKIDYRLSQHRDDAIMVEVTVPGERWEVEFLGDGTVDVEVFRSDGSIYDATALGGMLTRFSEVGSENGEISSRALEEAKHA